MRACLLGGNLSMHSGPSIKEDAGSNLLFLLIVMECQLKKKNSDI